ncbi:cGMP-dependent protein kinase egl-4 [Trichinella pseudospiralis]|uniref:cGMP-dependent protein kinase n=1 Tax=Trichinella pseudospiralis TaxID=6337 RepID=A0A0V1FWA9_TRIPS|nr:cGMP-dependent protein kinase egl-4 [Trichinella pseudospiralis]
MKSDHLRCTSEHAYKKNLVIEYKEINKKMKKYLQSLLAHRVKRGSSGGGAFAGNGGGMGDRINGDGTCKTGGKTARNRFLTNDVKAATSTLNSCSAPTAYGGKTPASDSDTLPAASCKHNDNNSNAGLPTKSGPTTPSSSSSYSSSSPAKHNYPAKSMKIKIGGRMTDIAELERLLEEKDKLIIQQDKDIKIHLAKIRQHEEQIKSLKSECDKLRSVLDLKVGESPTSRSKSSDELRAQLQMQASMVGQAANVKKQGVSAEPNTYKDKVSLVHYKKSGQSKQLIRNAILQNDFLRHLDREQVSEMVECMYERDVPEDEFVIREGAAGAHLYVAAQGELQVFKNEKMLGKMGPGKVFGELALLYNCTRTASVKAMGPVKLWVLDRAVFQMITMRLGLQRHETLMNFLRDVPLFKNLSEDRISKLADSMDLDYFTEGTYIIREGEKGDLFFIITSGTVRVTQLIDGKDEPQEIRKLQKGDFFGEKALLGDEVRTASIIAIDSVEVLTLDRESFQKLIGDLEELKRDYGDEQRGAKRLVDKRISSSDGTIDRFPSTPTKVEYDKEIAALELTHMQPIATLGVGGFGRVDLVFLIQNPTRTFALKTMKKKHIVDTRQQEHIFNERNLMFEFRSPYIVRLHKTFRDKKYVYMLLEACLGGEVWTILRDRGHFDDLTARFYVACVIEGLEYLHRKMVIYRDLKPENCLLDATGHLKIVDFGFAKRLPSGRKTWTFCGTPEYVAPEIILNKASDPMKTYTLILKGVDALDIPNRRIGKTATSLVKKLCRDNPAERLGCQSGGYDDLRKHRWFAGFDWEGLRSRSLPPPIIPKINGPTDISNFDHYPADYDVPPDELSGWDEGNGSFPILMLR